MKRLIFLLAIGFCCLAAGGGKTDMTEEDEKRLIQLYTDSLKFTDAEKLNAIAEEILQILSGLNENVVTKACRIHAYTTRGFVAYIQRDKTRAVRELEHSLSLLPEIQNTDFYFKWAAELYSVLAVTHFDNPQKAEYWLSKLENLIENEINGEHYRHDSRDYRIMVQTRKYECLLCRAEYLVMRKKDVRQAEKLLLSGIREREEKAKDFPLSPLLYSYDLLSEIYYRNRNEKLCRVYAEKCFTLIDKYNLLPKFADEHLYTICMKEKDYPAALAGCRMMLKQPQVQTDYSKLRRKYLFRAADVCEKLNDRKNADEYRAQAEKIKVPPRKKSDGNP